MKRAKTTCCWSGGFEAITNAATVFYCPFLLDAEKFYQTKGYMLANARNSAAWLGIFDVRMCSLLSILLAALNSDLSSNMSPIAYAVQLAMLQYGVF